MINFYGIMDNDVAVNSNNKSKIAFLTFDDGPSPNNTRKILKILKENDVKATFFIVGTKGEANPQILRELSNNGMCILPHSYSHSYKDIYSSSNSYFNDLNKCIDVIKRITGTAPLPYTRLPGGSDNLVSNPENLRTIRNKLNAKGIDYVDWNVSSGDASEETVTTSTIKNNVFNQCKNNNFSVILMHDTYYKNTTVEALPYTIKHLKEQGFEFRTFENLSAWERGTMINMGIINRR
ncbi:peptidoglycan/xylan/chitin deacetylase (PgdA/CDA1 family) [Clostridium tetanomorphum]|nr:polysaccharide deacetylase family protein [Clostridium tetanomorphum]MBP1863066.1 peptidoglycan/xylan/chitin deacetylase (PgdA/CDA1 family) [Clostridium tetanomorphum]NRS82895.1 peptidoglycan/xylan/chitin deacetylase (PgdA/CDA1 family) [Clostridium tetanomorphum]NRZ99009.1 peptidoglycan/xylan/chitin deacetylase (PgdA/CDA1 family) [Clostridium tetanomorphum]